MNKRFLLFRKHNNIVSVVTMIIVFALLFLIVSLPVSAERDFEKEEKIGRKIAAKIEKQYEPVEDAELIQKVQQIGEHLKEASGIAEINYQFKIIEREGPNAFAFPGGFIFLTADLFDYVQSDDELAAVMAHEMGHVIHQHSIKQLKDSKKLKLLELMTILVTGDPALGVLSELTSITILNAYRREYEEEADFTALELLYESQLYHPIALLTYFERVYSEKILKPDIKVGIFQTHPEVEYRIRKIKEYLSEHNIPFNRRLTTNYLRVTGDVQKEGQLFTANILLNEEIILSFSGNEEEMLRVKMNNVVSHFDHVLRLDLEAYAITVKTSEEEQYASLSIGTETIISLSPEEVQFHHMSPSEVLKNTRDAIARILWRLKLELPILLKP